MIRVQFEFLKFNRTFRLLICFQLSMLVSANLVANDIQPYGLYGKQWLPWIVDNHSELRHYIYNMDISPEPQELVTLRNLQSENIEILVVQKIHKSRKERWMKKDAQKDKSAEDVGDIISLIYADAAQNSSVTNISLDEENFWWNGRDVYLDSIYNHVKEKSPSINVWQFYAEGLRTQKRKDRANRFKVGADGYVFDEYRLSTDKYRRLLEGYVDQGKPVVSILWASPNWKPSGRQVRQHDDTWWDNSGWRGFYEKSLINKLYDVPTVYFIFDIGTDGKLMPTFQSKEKCSQDFVKKLFDETLPTLFDDEHPLVAPKERPSWIAEICPKP